MKRFGFTKNYVAYIFFVELIFFELLAVEYGALGTEMQKTIKNMVFWKYLVRLRGEHFR